MARNVRERLNGLFSQGRSTDIVDATDVADALRHLRPTTVTQLAQYAGQSAEELDGTFELLPLSIRMELHDVKAIVLSDDDPASDHFGHTVTARAVPLVNACAESVLRSGDPAGTAVHIAAIAAAQEALDIPLINAGAAGSDWLGEAVVTATVSEVDSKRGRARLQLINGSSLEPLPHVAEISYDIHGDVHAGTRADVKMAVHRLLTGAQRPKLPHHTLWVLVRDDRLVDVADEPESLPKQGGLAAIAEVRQVSFTTS